MTLYVAPIVEGHTEAECVERLLQRVWTELLVSTERLQVLQPSRGKRDALIDAKRADLSEKVKEAFARLNRRMRRDPATGRGFLLLLLDAERDCPAELAPCLVGEMRQARGDADIACALAKRMFENWIVAGASTLAGVHGLPNSLPARHQPEARSGTAWLETQLRSKTPRRKYKKTVDAKVFVQHMNLVESRANCPSFDKLCRELEARLPRSVDKPGESASSPPPSPATEPAE
jgi:hypothetical protein